MVVSVLVGSGRSCVIKIPYQVRTRERTDVSELYPAPMK